MLSKEIKMKNAKVSSFKRLTEYLTDSQNNDLRVQDVHISNCQSNNVKDAVNEILITQLKNTRATKDKTLHIILSFRPEDQKKLTPEIRAEIEEQFCKDIGLGRHQRICVFHGDTDNPHIHLAINKIESGSNKIKEPYQLWNTMSKLCEALENKYELRIDNHISNKKQSENIIDDAERMSGQQTLCSYIRKIKELNSAESWDSFIATCNNNNIKLKNCGKGFVFTDGNITVKASTVDRQFSKFQLEKKFGSYDEYLRISNNGEIEAEKTNNTNNQNFQDIFTDNNEADNDLEQSEAIVIAKLKSIVQSLKSAQDWTHFLSLLQTQKLSIKIKANGFVFTDGNITVKASTIDRDFSKAKLEKIYGKFDLNNDANSNDLKKYDSLIPVKELTNEQQKNLYEEFKEYKKLSYKNKLNKYRQILKNRFAVLVKKQQQQISVVAKSHIPYFLKKIIFRSIYNQIQKQKEICILAQRWQRRKLRVQSTWRGYVHNKALEGDQTAIQILEEQQKKQFDSAVIASIEDKLIKVGNLAYITKSGTRVYRTNQHYISVGKNKIQSQKIDDSKKDFIDYKQFRSTHINDLVNHDPLIAQYILEYKEYKEAKNKEKIQEQKNQKLKLLGSIVTAIRTRGQIILAKTKKITQEILQKTSRTFKR